MSLIVEDGTIVTGAESYISVSDADTYHSDRGATAWAALSTPAKEQALRRATEFMLGRYRSAWKGGRVRIDQPLDWPRQGANTDDFTVLPHSYYGYIIPYNVIPTEIKRACAELALRSSTSTLLLDQNQNVIEETVGPITTKYDQYSPQATQYVQVDNMLSPYLKSGGNSAMVKLSRV